MMQRTKGIVTFLIRIPLFGEVSSIIIIIIIEFITKFLIRDWFSVHLFIMVIGLSGVRFGP